MKQGFRSGFIALLGRPNAGKSTLLNKIVGQKIAIISDKPQTTRHKIVGVLTRPDFQAVFLDTPGIHKPLDKLGKMMIGTAFNALNEVDLIYYLVDISVPFGGGESFLIKKLQKITTPIFLLLNKIDCLPKEKLLPLLDFYRGKREWAEIVPLAALTGENVESLLQTTMSYLPEGPQYYPAEMITDQPEKVIIAELIREKILRETHEEIPHAVAVVVDLMEKRVDDLLYLHVTVYVERNSQKAIIIGEKGQMLKKIGSRARSELERLLGNRVFLELWVKVKPNWRKNEKSIIDLGY